MLGGVSVPERSTRWLSFHLEQIAQEINPTDSKQVEFHASDIFSGRDIWSNFNKQDRINMIKRVLLTLSQAYQDIVTFACAVHKQSFVDEDPVQKAFEDISSRFNLYLQRNSKDNYKAMGMIIFDESAYEANLQNLAAIYRAQGNRWGNQLRNICEIPLFVQSRASRNVQLSDHVAYAVFRRYNAGDLNYFNCIESRFDRDGGVMHGLSHLQKYNRNCTCPACITRR